LNEPKLIRRDHAFVVVRRDAHGLILGVVIGFLKAATFSGVRKGVIDIWHMRPDGISV
jgi:hypothetical protein